MPEISLFCGIRVTMFPKVLQAVAGEDFTVYLYFNDGSVRLDRKSTRLNSSHAR